VKSWYVVEKEKVVEAFSFFFSGQMHLLVNQFSVETVLRNCHHIV